MSEPNLSVTQHQAAASSSEGTRPLFYYDLGEPEAYLAAERVMAALPVVPEWVPVLAAGLPGESVTGEFEIAAGEEAPGRRAAIEALAARRHVQPLRWPAEWPGDSRRAMVAATYAKQIGRAVAFSLAAFRQAFAGGRDLADDDTILIAGAACEMHPNAVKKALDRDAIGAALDAATAEAAAAGVRRVPAVRIGDDVFHGDAGIDVAAEALTAALAAADGSAER